MPTAKSEPHGEMIRNLPRAHEWEVIGTFVLSLAKEMPRTPECMLKPVADALTPYGLEEHLLCEISAAVEDAGEDLRGNCMEGTLDCIFVRVNMSTQTARDGGMLHKWAYYLIKQMVSSESDNLEAMEHPTCYIDVYVH